MPLSGVTYGSGFSNLDPIIPELSKSYTYQNAVDLVRILGHASGNTTAITDAEIFAIVKDFVAQIAKEQWKALAPMFLVNNSFNIQGSAFPYTSLYSALSPYPDKVIALIFLQGSGRIPIRLVAPDQLERYAKMTNTYASSVFGSVNDNHIELFVGTDITDTPTDYGTEMYYFRQVNQTGAVVGDYIDIPDNYYMDVVDKTVARLEMTKD